MLETMVAAMVFAFGAIGATGMQILATEANHEAMYRTRAVYLATDLIERLRDNPEGLETYDSSADNLWRIVGSHSISKEPEPDCVSTSCTPQQLATHDLWAWEQVLDGKDVYREGVSATGGLPSPTGCIRYLGDGQVELAIAWFGRRSMSNAILATSCTVADRYGNQDEYRRVLYLRTYLSQ